METETYAAASIRPDSEFTHSGKIVQVGKVLGVGLTATVYLAQYEGREVALKVLKLPASPEVREAFNQEWRNIKSLWDYWKESELAELAPVVPEFYGAQDDYFMIELMRGRVLEDEMQNNAPLMASSLATRESTAIQIMEQFGGLLIILHEKLEKYYADIKFGNLWVETSKSGRPLLKVTDWNVLADRTPEGVERDIFFASLYLYRMLTGVSLPYLRTTIQSPLTDIPDFKNLSLGIQKFLRQALHPTPSLRFQDARQWYSALHQLGEWWRSETSQLLLVCVATIREADGLKATAESLQPQLITSSPDQENLHKRIAELQDQAADAYTKASIIIEISRRKGLKPAEEPGFNSLEGKIKSGLASTSHIERGLTALKGDLYQTAVAAFEAGAQTALDPQPLRRFALLAQAAETLGVEQFRKIKDQALAGVNAILEEDYHQAQTRLNECVSLLSGLHIPTILALRDEASIFVLVEQARQSIDKGDNDQGIDYYDKAIELQQRVLRDLPNAAAALGDLEQQRQEVKQRAEQMTKVREGRVHAEEALRDHNWSAATVHFRNILRWLPNDAQTIRDWKAAILGQFELGEAQAARQLAEPALMTAGVRSEIRHIWQWIEGIDQLKAALEILRQAAPTETEAALDEFIHQAQDYRRQFEIYPAAIGSLYHRILASALNTALEVQCYQQAELLAQSLDYLPTTSEEKDANLRNYQARVKSQVDMLLRQLETAVAPILEGNSLADLESAVAKTQSTKRLIPAEFSFEHESLDQLEKNLQTRIRRFYAETDDRKMQHAEDIKRLRQTIEDLEGKFVRRFEDLQRINIDETYDRQRKPLLINECGQIACNILQHLEQWREYDPTDPEIGELQRKYSDIKAAYGEDVRQRVYELAQQPRNAALKKLRLAEDAFNQGDLKAVNHRLQELGPAKVHVADELSRLEKLVEIACKLGDWIKEGCSGAYPPLPLPNTQELQTYDGKTQETRVADNFLTYRLPTIYWDKSGLARHFDDRSNDAVDHINNARSFDDTFYAHVCRLIRYRQAYRRVSIAAGGDPHLDQTVILADAIKAIDITAKKHSDPRSSLKPILIDAAERLPLDANVTVSQLCSMVEREISIKQEKASQQNRDRLHKVLYSAGALAGMLLMLVTSIVAGYFILNGNPPTVENQVATVVQQTLVAMNSQPMEAEIQATQTPMDTSVVPAAIEAPAAQTVPTEPAVMVTVTATTEVPEVSTGSGAMPSATATNTLPPPPPQAEVYQSAEELAQALTDWPIEDNTWLSFPAQVADDTIATASPAFTENFWTKNSQGGYKGGFYDFSWQNRDDAVSIDWPFAAGVGTAGLYAVFVNDLTLSSGINDQYKTINYQVAIDEQSVQPVAGTGDVHLFTSQSQGAKTLYPCVGIYNITPEQTNKPIIVTLKMTIRSIPTGSRISADAVILVPLNTAAFNANQVETLKPITDANPAKPLLPVLVMDNTKASLSPAELPWVIDPEMAESWEGAATLVLTDTTKDASATYTFSLPLPPGRYQFAAWVPSTSAALEFQFTMNGAPIRQSNGSPSEIEKLDPVKKPAMPGLFNFRFDIEANPRLALPIYNFTVTVKPAHGVTEGQAVIDALFLFFLPGQ
jgi:hypothetical protein